MAIYIGLIATILVIAHVILSIKWNLKDPVKTNRLMWLAIVIVFLQALSDAWLVNIILWVGVAIIDGYMTDKNRQRVKAEQEVSENDKCQ